MGFFFDLRKGSLFSLSLIRLAQIYDFLECPKAERVNDFETLALGV